MTLRARPAALLVVALALAAGGCSSNNTGKIVGKWRASGADLGAAGAVPGADAAMIWEFSADNKFEVTATIAMLGQTQTKKIASGKYSLGSGDNVTLSDLSPPIDGKTRSLEKIKIDGDTMTVAGKDGKSLTMTRVKN